MQAVGVDIVPAPGAKGTDHLTKLESGLRDQIIAAQQAKTGAPLGNEEARSIALRYVVDHALYGPGKDAWPGRTAQKGQE